MKLTRWNCLAVAFSLATGLSLETIEKDIGHDGGKILWHDLPEPLNRCGHHTQELIDVCLKHNISATMIEAAPWRASTADFEEFKVVFKYTWAERMERYLHNNSGVVIGVLKASKTHHAVYWDHTTQTFNDPLNKVTRFTDIDIGWFFITKTFIS